jgi:uncharacterized RDD family membrane protein YckC
MVWVIAQDKLLISGADSSMLSAPGITTNMLDTIYSIETPEGVELDLRLSGIPARMLAWIIDTFIRFGLYLVLSMLLAWAGAFGFGIYLILIFLVEWFYPVFFEVLSDGMTPGKRAMGIRVIHANGTPIGWPASITRNLLRFIDFLPLFYAFGVISMMLNRRFQRLGDLVAGSLVVYREDHRIQHAIPQAAAIVPGYALRSNEAQAIVHYAERMTQISTERAEELATTTGELIPKNKPAAQTLLGIAHWITGK